MAPIDPRRIQTAQELADQLAGLFHQRGLSIQRLASAARLSPATVQGIVSGSTAIPRAGTLEAFVTACGQPSEPWLAARGRVVRAASSTRSSSARQAELDEWRERAERAEAALRALGHSPEQVLRNLVSAKLQSLAARDPVAEERKHGHLYLVVHPVSGREDALAELFGEVDAVRCLETAVRRAVEARPPSQPFSPDLNSGVWEPRSDGFVSVRGIAENGHVRESSLLEVYVHEDGGVAVRCGNGAFLARSPWRPVGYTGELPLLRVVSPSLVLSLTCSALVLAGDLASNHASYEGDWQIGLRLDGLRGALADEHVRHGDDDTVRGYDQDVYERMVYRSAKELLDQPAAVTEQLVAPLLRGLSISRRYLPYGS
jgi:transcriptional regulator with XRE-family HTH domain